jgi:hypothetical protein
MRTTHYTQVALGRYVQLHNYSLKYEGKVVWIPSQYAKEGKKLFLKNGDSWESWEVMYLYTKQSVSYITAHKDDYRDQRKSSDIAEVPKALVARVLRS